MFLTLAAGEPAAGGAALEQVAIATGFGLFVTAAVIVLCLGHRRGSIGLLGWAGRLSERVSPLPSWAAFPAGMATVALLPTLFGLQWDESLHITAGRDEGPLANPSHYVLLQGIFAAWAAGAFAAAMADDRVGPSGVDVPGAWKMPAGALLMLAGASVAMIGFPLDDVWHRLFGQDVTLWGPTHVLMITGMSVSVLGIVVLVVEGLRAAGPRKAKPRPFAFLDRIARLSIYVLGPAGLLAVVSLLQGEFDWGVPQYRLLFHPMMIAGAAGFALVAARIFFGRGAALASVIGFLIIRTTISVTIGPIFGLPWHMFGLYLVEALIVEAVAARVGTERPVALAVWSGVFISTVGLASEWAWSNLFAYPWNTALFPEIGLAVPMGVAAALIGAWVGTHLQIHTPTRPPALRHAAVASAVVITAIVAYGLHESSPSSEPIIGSVELTDISPEGGDRLAGAEVTISPASASENATWVNSIAWQGGDLVTEPLIRTGPGSYVTDTPLPLHGDWKSSIRLHFDDQLLSIPVFLPADEAIPAPEIAAPAAFTRNFAPERQLLQREAKDVGEGMLLLGTLVVAFVAYLLLAISAWIVHRMGLAGTQRGLHGGDAAPGGDHAELFNGDDLPESVDERQTRPPVPVYVQP